MIPAWDGIGCPVVGMLHLRPLPGAPRFGGRMDDVREALLADADALAEGGVQGLLLENFGDSPFYPGRVPAEVVAHMTALAALVKRRFDLPLGINVLRNDGESALAVAQAAGAELIRVNVLCGARVTDQGVVEGIAHRLLRRRRELGATEIRIFADADVKHSAALAPRPLEEEIAELVGRGGADAVIVSGAATGRAVDPEQVEEAARAAGDRPVWVGSGVSAENVGRFAPARAAAGLIIGTAFKRGGISAAPVERERVRALMERVR